MATLAQLNAFITYLEAQANVRTINGTVYGEPYIWGGQHTHLTPSNYQSVINSMESDTWNRIYDCSGLGMYFWQNVEHVYPGDKTADGMMSVCTLYPDPPKRAFTPGLVTILGKHKEG